MVIERYGGRVHALDRAIGIRSEPFQRESGPDSVQQGPNGLPSGQEIAANSTIALAVVCTCRPARSRAIVARIVSDGTISSAADKLDRRAVELVVVSIGDAHGAPPGTQLGTND